MATNMIGLMGKARSGKDTAAQYLIEDHGYTRLAFADVLKAAALDVDPIIDGDQIENIYLSEHVALFGWERAKEHYQVRRFLQNLGVAMRDHIGGTVWIDPVMRAAQQIAGPVVITDVRFPNEGDAVRKAGGMLVRVKKIGQVTTDTHVSETLMDTYPVALDIEAEPGDLRKLRRGMSVAAEMVEPTRRGLSHALAS